jgi:hypothetical protein
MRQLVAHGDYSTTANCREKKYPPIFWNFRGISRFLCIIPRLLAGPQTTFCETLVGKHWNKVTNIILASGSSDMATFKLHALANSFYKFIRTYFILIFNIKFRNRRDKDNLQKGANRLCTYNTANHANSRWGWRELRVTARMTGDSL